MSDITAEGGGENAVGPGTVAVATRTDKEDSHGYFRSYADLKVHEVMLRDWPRTNAYRTFFEDNAHLVRNKVVMDVGAGTGLLSLFAASVGARKVYAVEASDTAHLCREIVDCNGFSDTIEVVHSQVENMDLKGAKVDMIVSEWMGFYLLHESMLDSVIVARDRFLIKDGIMVPSVARLYLAPVDMGNYLEEKLGFWSNVCGFDFSPAAPYSHRRLLQEPLTLDLQEAQVLSAPQVLQEFDLKTVSVAQVQALSDRLSFQVESSATIHGFAMWFDVYFPQGVLPLQSQPVQMENSFNDSQLHSDQSQASASSLLPVKPAKSQEVADSWKCIPASVLSTSPAALATHWKQTVILLPSALSPDPSVPVSCQVTLTQCETNKRHYNIELEMVDDSDDDDDKEDDDEAEDHPVPCRCEQRRCQLIRLLMEKYGEEQDELQAEAELVERTVEVEAAQAIFAEMGEDNPVGNSSSEGC